MSIKLNNQLITSLKLNNQDATEVKLNNIRVYPSEPQMLQERNWSYDPNTFRYGTGPSDIGGYPSVSSIDYNRFNLIGGPGLDETKLNQIAFKGFNPQPSGNMSGVSFDSFNIWYEILIQVQSMVYQKAEIRFGPNFFDLRKGEFSENDMVSWFSMGWDVHFIEIPVPEPQILVEFDFPWDSQTNSYHEFGYPAPVSEGDNYNRVNLIGGPGLKESRLNDLLFNVFGYGAQEKTSGNFTNFNVWYEAVFPVVSGVFAKAEIRFGENYIDLRKSQFSENNMASWYSMVWDFNGIEIPLTKEWVYLFNSSSSNEYITGQVGSAISIFGYFGGDPADMQDYMADNYPPDSYDVGRVLVAYDYDTGYYYFFQVV